MKKQQPHIDKSFLRASEGSEHPFPEADIMPTKRPKLLGIHVKNPAKALGAQFQNLPRGKKQNLMYVLQCTAASCLLAGGIAGLAVGAPAAMSLGLLTTGALNSLRSIGQYTLRKVLAKSPEKSSKTEMVNSMASGLTNAPQALSGSIAGVAAVCSYVLRMMKYSLESKQDRLESDAETAEKANPLAEHDITSTKSRALGPVRKGGRVLWRSFNKAAVKTGEQVEKIPGGEKVLTSGPGHIMVGRGVLQAAEGFILLTTAGAIAGAPVLAASAIYISAATIMRSADSQQSSPETDNAAPDGDRARQENEKEEDQTAKYRGENNAMNRRHGV